MYIKYVTDKNEQYIKNLINIMKSMLTNIISRYFSKIMQLQEDSNDYTIIKKIRDSITNISYLKFDGYYLIGLIPDKCDSDVYDVCRSVNDGTLDTKPIPIFSDLFAEIYKKQNYFERLLL